LKLPLQESNYLLLHACSHIDGVAPVCSIADQAKVLLIGLVWMCMYLSESTCVGVVWSGIKLNSIPMHSTTCGLKWIHMHPNKAIAEYKSYMSGSFKFTLLGLSGEHTVSYEPCYLYPYPQTSMEHGWENANM
jgi:hypothetical protein